MYSEKIPRSYHEVNKCTVGLHEQIAPGSGAVNKLKRSMLSTGNGPALFTTPNGRTANNTQVVVIPVRGNAQEFQKRGTEIQR